MPTEQQQNPVVTQPVAASGGPEEFLSLRDMLIMILRHRRAIFLFVLLVTLAAGIFFITRPRQYAAESYLQVMAPISSEGRVDKELFETAIASHLQKASSAYIAKNVAVVLNNQGLTYTPLELEKQIAITRPPKTHLIRLVTVGTLPDNALLLLRLWVREYLASVQKNNVYMALSQNRNLLKLAQSDLMEKQAAMDKIRVQVTQTAQFVTLSRAVDDRQIWSDLTQKMAPDPETLKKLAEIHIKGQEQSEEYINLKTALLSTDQALSMIMARRNLYNEVVQMLEAHITLNGNYQACKMMQTNATPSEAEFYVNTLLKSSDIIQFGEPGLISAPHGALKKTGLVFLASLALACFGAFMCEWGKGLLAPR